METLVKAIQSTPIPTMFITVGLFIVVLAFVNKIGGFIEVSPDQKRWAIPIGLFLLVIGLGLHLATPQPPQPDDPEITPSPAASSPSSTSPSTADISDLKGYTIAIFYLEDKDYLSKFARDIQQRLSQRDLNQIILRPKSYSQWKGFGVSEANTIRYDEGKEYNDAQKLQKFLESEFPQVSFKPQKAVNSSGAYPNYISLFLIP